MAEKQKKLLNGNAPKKMLCEISIEKSRNVFNPKLMAW
jgi:hypothetical protein